MVHVELHDEWYDTPARQGDRANLVGSFPTTCGCGNSLHQRCTSLRRGDEGLLVLRPEHLITGTSLSVAVNCPRKVVIGKGGSDDGGASERMILGTMKHMVFEALLTRWMSDRAKADQRMQQQQQHAAIALHPAAANNEEEDAELLDSIMFRHSDKLLALNVNTSTLRTDLRNFAPTLRKWFGRWLPHPSASTTAPSQLPQPLPTSESSHITNGVIKAIAALGLPTSSSSSSLPPQIALSGVIGAEEELTSLVYGLKGQIDGIVAASLIGPPSAGGGGGSGGGEVMAELPLPIELKTGKRTDSNAAEHAAQLLVYMLLLSERHHTKVPLGVLYYPQLSDTAMGGVMVVPTDNTLISALMMQRNRLVGACAPDAVEEQRMPQPLGDEFSCARCEKANSCAVMHRAVEGGNAQTFGLPHLFESKTLHLTPSHIEYVNRWLRLIKLEESVTNKLASEMTQLTAKQRESSGRALSDLVLVSITRAVPTPDDAASPLALPRGNDQQAPQWLHTFRRRRHDGSSGDGSAPLPDALGVGDLITIAIEPPSSSSTASFDPIRTRWGVSRGRISNIDAVHVTIPLDVQLTDLGVVPAVDSDLLVVSPSIVRIDKCEIASTFQTCRANVLSLVAPDKTQLALPPPQQPGQPLHLRLHQLPHASSTSSSTAHLPALHQSSLHPQP